MRERSRVQRTPGRAALYTGCPETLVADLIFGGFFGCDRLLVVLKVSIDRSSTRITGENPRERISGGRTKLVKSYAPTSNRFYF